MGEASAKVSNQNVVINSVIRTSICYYDSCKNVCEWPHLLF